MSFKCLFHNNIVFTFFFTTDAAEVLQGNRRLFEQNVQKAMRGGFVGSVYFDRTLK